MKRFILVCLLSVVGCSSSTPPSVREKIPAVQTPTADSTQSEMARELLELQALIKEADALTEEEYELSEVTIIVFDRWVDEVVALDKRITAARKAGDTKAEAALREILRVSNERQDQEQQWIDNEIQRVTTRLFEIVKRTKVILGKYTPI